MQHFIQSIYLSLYHSTIAAEPAAYLVKSPVQTVCMCISAYNARFAAPAAVVLLRRFSHVFLFWFLRILLSR